MFVSARRVIIILMKLITGLLIICMFGLRGFSYTRLKKIININKIVRFMMRNQLYSIFGCAQVKVNVEPVKE